MSADSPHNFIRCEASSRDGFAARPENNNRRIRGGLILETYRRSSLDQLRMTLDLKREIWSRLYAITVFDLRRLLMRRQSRYSHH
jgi:hypothetical protein